MLERKRNLENFRKGWDSHEKPETEEKMTTTLSHSVSRDRISAAINTLRDQRKASEHEIIGSRTIRHRVRHRAKVFGEITRMRNLCPKVLVHYNSEPSLSVRIPIDVSIDTTEPKVLLQQCSGDDIKMTQRLLGKIITKPELRENRLRQPTFRFLHDVILAVLSATGFANNLYDEKKDYTIDKDSKRDFLDRIVKVVALQLYPLVQGFTGSMNLPGWTRWWWLRNEVRPSMIVAGLNPEETNKFLQLLAIAAVHFSESKASVEIVRNSLKLTSRQTTANNNNLEKSVESQGDTVTLFVKMPDGHTAVLHDIAPSADIEELHYLLQAVEQQDGKAIPALPSSRCQLQLVYSSKHLQPGHTVGDYNLQTGSTLFGLLRILGGVGEEAAEDVAAASPTSPTELLIPQDTPINGQGMHSLIERSPNLSDTGAQKSSADVAMANMETRISPAGIGTPVTAKLSPLLATGPITASTLVTAAGTDFPLADTTENFKGATESIGFVQTIRAKAKAGRGQGNLVESLREWVSGGCRDGRALVCSWAHSPGAVFCQQAPFVTETAQCDRWRQPPRLDGIGCKCKGDCSHAYGVGPVKPPAMPAAIPKPLPIPPVETGIEKPRTPESPVDIPGTLPHVDMGNVDLFDPPEYHPVFFALVRLKETDKADEETLKTDWYFNPGANTLEDVICEGYGYFINEMGTEAFNADEIDRVFKEWGMNDGIEFLAEYLQEEWNGSLHGTQDYKTNITLNEWVKRYFSSTLHKEERSSVFLANGTSTTTTTAEIEAERLAYRKRHLLLYDIEVATYIITIEARRAQAKWLQADKLAKDARAADIARFEKAWDDFKSNKEAYDFAVCSEREAGVAVRDNADIYWKNATEFYGGKSDLEGMLEVWKANESARARLRKSWDKFKADICAYERAGFSWPNKEVVKAVDPTERKKLYVKEWSKQLELSSFQQQLVELSHEVNEAVTQTRHLPETASKRNIDTLWELHKAQARAHTTDPRQLIDNIDDLGEHARRLDPHFQKVLSFWISGLDGQIMQRKKSKRQMVHQLMSINYDGSRLCDILSGSVDFATIQGLTTCLNRIRMDERVVLVAVKNYLDVNNPDHTAPDGTHQVWIYLTIVDNYTMRQVRVQAEDRLDGFICEVKLGLLVLENGPGKHEERMQAREQSAMKKQATKELLIASGLNSGLNARLIEGRMALLRATNAVEDAQKALYEANQLHDVATASAIKASRKFDENSDKYKLRNTAGTFALDYIERAKEAISEALSERKKVDKLDKEDIDRARKKALDEEMRAIISAKTAALSIVANFRAKKSEEEEKSHLEEISEEQRLAQELARMHARMEILKNIKAFRKFSEEKLKRAAEDLEEEEYAPQDVVISQGDMGEEFFIIEKGFALVYVTKNLDPGDPLANAKEVARLEEKQYFGEVALLKGERRGASIVAGDNGLTALKMDKTMFKNIMENKGTKSGTWENGMVARNKKIKDLNFPHTWWAGPSQIPLVKLKPGVRVEANFKGKNIMMPGYIVRTGNGKYSVKYENGEIESNVRIENIVVQLVVNDRVAARYNGMKKYYSGKISRVGADGSFNIQYDDGEEEYAVRRDYICILALVENRIDEYADGGNAGDSEGHNGSENDSEAGRKKELTKEEKDRMIYEAEMRRVQEHLNRRQTRIVGVHNSGKQSMASHMRLLAAHASGSPVNRSTSNKRTLLSEDSPESRVLKTVEERIRDGMRASSEVEADDLNGEVEQKV